MFGTGGKRNVNEHVSLQVVALGKQVTDTTSVTDFLQNSLHCVLYLKSTPTEKKIFGFGLSNLNSTWKKIHASVHVQINEYREY